MEMRMPSVVKGRAKILRMGRSKTECTCPVGKNRLIDLTAAAKVM